MKWPRVPWGKLGKSALLFFLLVLLVVSTGVWYLTTNSFQRVARQRLIAEIERATGGRVELGSFHAVPLHLQVEIRNLTIHGREAANEHPLVHVDRVAAVLSISSALGFRLGFHSLLLDHPIVHIIFYPDGSTNQPKPSHQGSSDLEHLFSFSARRLEVKQGELFWQDQRLPLAFSSNDVSANLNYSFLHLRYSGSVGIGRAETHVEGLRPVAWAARANFNFDRNGIQINSLQAISDRSQLRASGVHVDFQKLAAAGKYELNLDLAQAGAVSRHPELKGGELRMVGDGAWSQQGFFSSGAFTARSVAWQDKTFSGRDLSADGSFSAGPNRFSLSRVEGQFLRGAFSADAEVLNWQAPPNSAKKNEQQGTARIRTKNVLLSEILSSLGPKFRPANELKFVGNVSAGIDIRWRRSIEYAQANVSADVTPPPRPQVGRLPVRANVAASYDFQSGDLQVTQLLANTPATQIHASGSLANSVRLSLSTTDVNEWKPILAELFPGGAPVAVRGRAAFNGYFSGIAPNVRLAGNLQLSDFDAFLEIDSHAAQEEIHWDFLSSDVQASSTNLFFRNAVLKRGGETIKANGALGLVEWRLVPESSARLHIDVQNANAHELAGFVGYDHDLSGQLSGELRVSGTRAQPQGQGDFKLVDGTIQGEPFDSVASSIALNGTQLAITKLEMNHGDAHVNGSGLYDLVAKSIQFDIHGANFSLAEFAPIEQSKLKVAGKLDFTAHVSGTTAQPQVAADLHLRNLTLNDQVEGNFLLSATSHGPNVQITGRSDFKDAELQMDGSIRLRDQWPTHINFHFSHLNGDPLLNTYSHSGVIRHSALAGSLTLNGPLRDPHKLVLAGDLSDIYAEAGKTSFRNDGPIHFALSGAALEVDNFHILGESTDVSGGGSIQFSGGGALDFHANGKVDLKLIQAYDRDITSSGTLLGSTTVSGTLDSPIIKGKLQIQNAAIADINVPSALSEINGTLLFSQNHVTIDSLNAHVGGGNVGFTGHAALVERRLDFDLNATANSVRLRYPPGVSSTADAQFHWSGSSAGSLLSGEITVNKLGFTPGFDFGAYLERTAEVSSLPQTDPVLNTIRLDLHLVTTPELQMQTSVIRLQGSADLHVRGSAAKPILIGRADVFEGQAYFNGTKYTLERGGITFSNPAVTTPFLDLEAVTRIRDYDVTLSLTGDISKPNGLKVNYRSDPPLPTADIIALLAFGQTTEESAQLQQTNQSAFSQQASSAMLAAALNATLNNRAQRLFGNSRIKIDPQGLESETSTVTQSGPAVTIEQQVKDNLTLSYTTDVSQTSQQLIRAEYNVSKNVSIVAIRDQNGVVSFDITIRRRRR
ncbi:MAG TPA: translocation/assembly module TamB domain-containing protein [Terriglobales bacterium]|nr:translocation/assembly module TamB domain-containing protein [Terriglobales bacterium]